MRNDAPWQRNQWAVSNQALSLVRALAGRVGTQQRYRSASDETMIAEDILVGEHPSLAGDTWRHCHHGILPVTPAAGFRPRHFRDDWTLGTRSRRIQSLASAHSVTIPRRNSSVSQNAKHSKTRVVDRQQKKACFSAAFSTASSTDGLQTETAKKRSIREDRLELVARFGRHRFHHFGVPFDRQHRRVRKCTVETGR